ncbi:acyl carrier protein [Nonomuraea sp. NPDC048916]|uniref:acyl carrier protein n=1 Tax=Nonomuraea sp. NPDC048916 TaxID=3154232 RepID=UPI00340DE60A
MWDGRFEGLLRQHLPFLPTGAEIAPDLSLRDFGLDSIGTVELLAVLEDAYQVRFTNESLRLEHFATPGVLWETLGDLDRGH